MQAIILAGGMGTRLRPLTSEVPKPMVQLINKPIMEYSIDLLKKYNITDIGITLMYLPQYVKNYFGNGENFGVNISYYTEETPLGTAGSVKLAEESLDDTFIVISGDALININFEKILKYHESIGADVTIVLSKQSEPSEFGVVLADTSGKIISFIEKPQWENVVSDTVNTGIYVINKKVLEKIPQKIQFDFSKDLFPLLLKENYNLFGYITEDYWCDLGTTETYLKACKDILLGKVFDRNFENVLCENVTLSENVKLIPPVFVGENTILNGKCVIGPNVVIGKDCIIENSDINDSVILNNNLINSCNFSGNIIANKNKLNSCFLCGKNVIGSNVIINKNAQIKYGVNIFDNVEILPEDIIEKNVYKKNLQQKNKFGDNGISGIWNHDITAENLSAIASSYKGEKIFISSNNTSLGNTLVNLLASYYSLCGVTVYTSVSNEGSCRFFSFVNKIKSVYVYENSLNINIQLINEMGLNISHNEEKSINLNVSEFSTKQGKITRLNSIDKDFEYFLNSAIPFCKTNVQIFSKDKYRLHNLIWEQDNTECKLTRISDAFVCAPNGVITDLYDKTGKLSLATFLQLKCDVIRFLGGKSVFLPSYTPDEIVNNAKNYGLKIYKQLQHKGDSMMQAENFIETSVLIEYVPAFFAEALAFYLSHKSIRNNDTVITRYDFRTSPENACKTIYALNKNKEKDIISTKIKNSFITIVPKNNGYIFSAYGRFFNEEYAPDIIEHFIDENSFDKNKF